MLDKIHKFIQSDTTKYICKLLFYYINYIFLFTLVICFILHIFGVI